MLGQKDNPAEIKTILKNAFWSFRGKVAYTVLITVYYVLLARVLGAEEFGIFTGLLAFLGFFHPFLGFGYDDILIKYIARDRNRFPHAFGLAILVYGTSGVIILAGAVAINETFFEDPFSFFLFLNVIVAEFCFRIVEFFGRAFQGFERLNAASKTWIIASLFKLAVILVFWAGIGVGYDVSGHTAVQWSWYYLISGVAALLVTGGGTFFELGLPSFGTRPESIRFKFGEGFAFSISKTTIKIYSDVDKFMLLKLSNQYAAGIYSAAYQFIKVAYIPMQSILMAAYPRFFQKGFQGAGEIWSFIKRVMRLTGSLGVLVSVTMYLAAPLAPLILGEDYSETVEILRWLAVVPLLQSFYIVFADALSGADLQKVRSTIQIFIVILNVGLNFWLIPLYSWWGAVAATIASEATLLLAFGAVAVWRWKGDGT